MKKASDPRFERAYLAAFCKALESGTAVPHEEGETWQGPPQGHPHRKGTLVRKAMRLVMDDDIRRNCPETSRPLPEPAEQRGPARVDQLRVARPVSDLARTRSMYCAGLGWSELSAFVDHQGFDGIMLGIVGAPYHFEFTVCRAHPVTPRPTSEDLLVLYVPGREEWARRCEKMRDAGFRQVPSFNPHWEVRGCTFEDPDGYRVVLECAYWEGTPSSR